MNNISPVELSRLIGISRQGVGEAIKKGLIPHKIIENKKTIDLDDPGVKVYIETATRQRELAKMPSGIPPQKINKTPTPAKKKKGKLNKSDNRSSVNNKKPVELNNQSDLNDIYEINIKTKLAELQKKQMQVQILEKNYFPREFMENFFFPYIYKLNTTLERSASVFINEVGQKILEAGEVTPAHIEEFISLVLEAIHNTKNAINREIKNYEPKL